MALPPLAPDCADCREYPAFITRQKAVGKRPALAWHQCCYKHEPGNKVAARTAARFHETHRFGSYNVEAQ